MAQRPYFPLFVDLSEKKVLVVGGGKVAKRRIGTLTAFTGDLTVITPERDAWLDEQEQQGLIRVRYKYYEREDLYGADLVIAATSDSRVNEDIHAACKCLGIPVNISSDRTRCDFYFPGIARKDPLVVGVTAGGRDHGLCARMTRKLQEWLEGEE